MKKILVTGATGEIGIELVPELRRLYGNNNVVAGIHRKEPPEEIKKGPYTKIDVTDYGEIERVIREYQITHIFHLSSVLSGAAEANPRLAFQVNIVGLDNLLEAARKNGVIQVVYPSSIAAFGPDTPRDNTPNDTIQRPTTAYGISKVFGERWGDYYAKRYGLDVREVRFPGIISPKEKPPEPPNGTTDAFPLMIWNALIKKGYESYLSPDTRLPMMYLPDAINALIKLSEAPLNKLKHHADFNVAAFSITPAELAEALKKRIPAFEVTYDETSELHKSRQPIADSWPKSLDDSVAREEWGWKHEWSLDRMVDDMLNNLKKKLAIQ